MAYEFKNLNEVEQLSAPTENTTVMAFDNGTPVQIPAGEFGGGKAMFFELPEEDLTFSSEVNICTKNYDALYEHLVSGGIAYLQMIHPERGDINLTMSVLTFFIMSGMGLVVCAWAGDSPITLLFDNGSYNGEAPAPG